MRLLALLFGLLLLTACAPKQDPATSASQGISIEDVEVTLPEDALVTPNYAENLRVQTLSLARNVRPSGALAHRMKVDIEIIYLNPADRQIWVGGQSAAKMEVTITPLGSDEVIVSYPAQVVVHGQGGVLAAIVDSMESAESEETRFAETSAVMLLRNLYGSEYFDEFERSFEPAVDANYPMDYEEASRHLICKEGMNKGVSRETGKPRMPSYCKELGYIHPSQQS